jgi:hypothetical protein
MILQHVCSAQASQEEMCENACTSQWEKKILEDETINPDWLEQINPSLVSNNLNFSTSYTFIDAHNNMHRRIRPWSCKAMMHNAGHFRYSSWWDEELI